MNINRRNTLSATSNTDLVATADPTFTVGAPTAPEELLPTDSFPGWALDRRSHMSFDGPSGKANLKRAEVVRAPRAVTGDSGNERASKVALVNLTEGKYQITTKIATRHVSTPTKREALYINRMFRYLCETADYVAVSPVQINSHFPSMRRDSHSICHEAICLVYGYGRSMPVGHLILQRDYNVLSTSLESVDEHSNHPCCEFMNSISH